MTKTKKEAKLQKKEYDKNQREAMKNDPQKLEKLKQKERMKYLKKKEKQQVKDVNSLTPREHRIKKKQWKVNSKNYKDRKKNERAQIDMYLQDNTLPSGPAQEAQMIPYDEGGQDLAEQCPKPRLSAPSRSFITSPPSLAKRQRVVGPLAKQNELLSLACKYLMKSEPQDDVPTIAKVWGEKLVTLDTQQRLFAEKAINDVLFEASLGSLNRYSVKINEDPYQHSSVHSFHSTSRD